MQSCRMLWTLELPGVFMHIYLLPFTWSVLPWYAHVMIQSISKVEKWIIKEWCSSTMYNLELLMEIPIYNINTTARVHIGGKNLLFSLRSTIM